MNKEYVSAAGRVLIVYFEDLLKDHCSELRRIVAFLGLSVEKLEARLLCLEDNSTGYFKRKPKDESFDPFKSTNVKVINDYVIALRKHFANRNFPPLPKYEKMVG